MKTRLEEHYHAAVRPALMEKFGYKNTLEVPKIEKINHQHGRRRGGARLEED